MKHQLTENGHFLNMIRKMICLSTDLMKPGSLKGQNTILFWKLLTIRIMSALLKVILCGKISPGRLFSAWNPPCRFAASPLKAVSYTHLRAHETVLDLVCR